MAPHADHGRFLAELERHKAILYKVANAYCDRREDRADLVQEIVIQLWRAFDRFDGRSRFSTFAHRIAMNVAISFHRGESCRVRDALPLEDYGLDIAAADRVIDAAGDDVRSLHQLIARLDAIDRGIILLYLEGYGHDEIAEMIGITTTNVATRINRIKLKLQRSYGTTEETA